jgi:hypothetical protein
MVKGDLLILQKQPSGNPTSSHLIANQEKLAKEMMHLALQSTFVNTSKGHLICRKILRHGADDFTSTEGRKACCGFLITLKNPSPSTGTEPASLWFNGKHANHYTTKDDIIIQVTRTSVTPVNTCKTTWGHNQQHSTPHFQRREILKYHVVSLNEMYGLYNLPRVNILRSAVIQEIDKNLFDINVLLQQGS